MTPGGRIFGAGRLVVYLPAAMEALEGLDGSREQSIRKQAEKFISAPESAFDKHPREYVSHIRHLDSNTRAFATWAQNTTLDRELCVVHEIYRKKNEDLYWADIEDLNERGAEFASGFEELNESDFDGWISKIESSDEVVVVSNY